MPFPTTCPCPRPILKKHHSYSASDVPSTSSASSPRDESAQLLGIDPSILQPLVHFAPTNNLTRTFTAYSPSIYDRSPIVVSPNKCSLPARGCPGKTYLPGDEEAHSSSKPKKYDSLVEHSGAGRHLHPRAVRVQIPYGAADEEDDELTPRASKSSNVHSHPLPPLVLDLSSSSESDESDGFSSPPLDCAPMSSSIHSIATSSPPGLPIPQQEPALYLSPISSPTTPLPFRSRTFASFSRFSSHPASSRSHSPCRDASPSSSPSRRRRSHSKPRRNRQCVGSPVSPSELETRYKNLSERSALAGCTLEVPDVGCFGGF